MQKVLVLNQSYEPLMVTTVEKAFILTYLNKAEVIETHDQPLRSVNGEYERPSVIRLKHSIRFRAYKTVELNRRNIFKRDNHTCAYCGSSDDLTVDHIVPKSKGGLNTWDNLITACRSCNNRKDDLSLEEAGLVLEGTPRRPHYIMFMGHGLTNVYENWKPYLFMK